MTSTQTTAREKSSVPEGKKRKAVNLALDGVSEEQRRRAAVVLEVLAGVRTPSQAASSLSLSMGAYYKLESRALQSLLDGCRAKERGPRSSPERQLAKLLKEKERLGQELQRYQALARAAQRVVGLSSPTESPGTDARGRRKRRPAVRALRAAAALEPDGGSPSEKASEV